ncbi:MAG: aminotransferase class IV [Candidatus Omnitrophica bacterium]|nr:aminotransferase class IV [Candidatus Omnitrophota bacterium]
MRDGEFPVDFLGEVSCFETLRVYDGRPFRLAEHCARLGQSCAAIGRTLPCAPADLGRWMKEAVRESGFGGAIVRLGVHWAGRTRTEVTAVLREFSGHPPRLYREGVALKTAVPRRWTLRAQDPRIKASQFVGGVLAFLEASGQRPHEFVFLNSAGTVAEGSVSNLFVVDGAKRLLTPSVSSGILRGVTRDVLMVLAKKKGFEVLETALTRHEIYSAKECFMTNTSSEVLPVVRVDERVIGQGAPGEVTRMLAAEFKKEVLRSP